MQRAKRLVAAAVLATGAMAGALSFAQEMRKDPVGGPNLIQNPEVLPKAGDEAATKDPASHAQVLIERGLEFLKSQQKPDGGWHSEKEPPGLTAIVLRAFAQSDKYPKEPFVKKGFERLLS